MKCLKKLAMGASIVGLTLTLGACGQDQSSKDKEKTVTMAEILNGKQERKIVMTYDRGHGQSPDVQWAGTIGNGKVEIYPYSHYNNDLESFEFNEIKDKSMKDYKKILKQRTKEYSNQKERKLNIKPEKARLLYRPNDEGDKAEYIGLDYNAKAYDDKEEFLMKNKAYKVIVKDHPKQWLEIRTKDESGKGWTQYHMHIEAKDGEKNLRKENLEEVKKKYDNIKILERAS
ncbi:hypothetical protein KXP69_002267 [Staphylococcus pseudintermedius]|nr:hypothetical protein [Staphylococcus pseudintermedius]MDE9937881.1 hypothetical protein [Staphylococcus pseudintermedius]